ncbi:MAG: hypothetical protein LBC27_00820 [Spirochaetaceae bacterium]|jgi:hypothetical protein|nr:hypothetical protein [Spirochaetaceae bacterium]
MKTFKNIKTLFTGLFLAGTLLLSGCPGAEGGIDLPATSGGGNSGRTTEVPAELQLANINVFYANDGTRHNLINFNNPKSGAFTADDVENGEVKGRIVIEAEAKDPEVSILITWNNEGATGEKSGGMTSAAAGAATVENMPLPAGGYPLTVNVKTSKDAKSYTTVITLKAPGADASLKTLSVTKTGDTDTELLPDLGLGGGDDETFWPYVYDYAIVFKDAGDAKAALKITAEAASADSVITLTQDGNSITNPTNPAPPNASAALLSGGDGSPDGEDPDPSPAPASETEKRQYSWNVNVGDAGKAPSEIALTVTNGDVINRYWILLVPPPDTSMNEAYLSLLDFRYGNGSPAVPNFNGDVQTYNVEAPQSETTVSLKECAARGNGRADITYKTVNRETGETVGAGEQTINSLPASLTLPIAGETELVVTVTVTVPDHDDRTMVYTVKFRKSENLSAYRGTYTLTVDGTSKAASALVAVTADNTEHTATIETGTKNWSVAIDKKLGAPVKFAVMYKTSAEDSMSYRTSITAPGGSSKTGISLTFSVAGSSAGSGENNYLYVQNAEQLKTLGVAGNQNKNYYLANDIDLTTLTSDWNGPRGYAGKFNGNGKTITLELTKTEGDTGLFDQLGDGAVIENLNVVVSSPDGGLLMTAKSHFGGVVGGILSGNTTIRGVSVKGVLEYADLPSTGFLLVGALIGEVVENKTATVLVENCEADIDITVNATGIDEAFMIGVGGLIGKTSSEGNGQTVTIKNCRTGGKITINSDKGDIFAGGIDGTEGKGGRSEEKIAAKLIMENCYSSMDISVNITGQLASHVTAGGGLIGQLYNSNTGSTIKNNIALNPKVLVTSNNTSKFGSGRIVGRNSSSGTFPKDENYALSTMLTGAGSGAEAADSLLNGKGKTAAYLSESSTWNGLGFTTDNWDFTGLDIAKGVYPKLKKKN